MAEAQGATARSGGCTDRAGASTPRRRPYRERIRERDPASIAPPLLPVRAVPDPTLVEELGRTMARAGLLQLPGVRRIGRNKYELLWGHHRVLAALAAGWAAIEGVLVDDVDDCEAPIVAIVENTPRRALADSDRLRMVQALREFGLDGHAIATRTGLSESAVSRLSRIGEHGVLRAAVDAGATTLAEAQELLGVADTALPALLAAIADRHAAGTPLRVVADLRPRAAPHRPAAPVARPQCRHTRAGVRAPAVG
jgi:ParB/RepB/Spo0J family partition protein